jgi:hypothetical protein
MIYNSRCHRARQAVQDDRDDQDASRVPLFTTIFLYHYGMPPTSGHKNPPATM